MICVRRRATLVVAGLVFCGLMEREAQAQVVPDGPYSAQVDAGLTVGNHEALASGLELGWWLRKDLKIFAEANWMLNVASRDLDARAGIIAEAIGGTAAMEAHATIIDLGVRYAFRAPSFLSPDTVQPFVLAGAGIARFDARPSFTVGGTDVTSTLFDTYRARLGLDLDGHLTKAVFVVGGGATMPLTSRYFIEGSVRYGHIFPRKAVIANDTATPTTRFQASFGARF